MVQPSIRRLWVVASVAACGLGSAPLSAAPPDPVALIWNAPAGCPSMRTIHDDVQRSLGGSAKELAPVAAAVSVVEASPGHWQASLMVQSHGKWAERKFEAESCQALGSATALIIALAAEGEDDAAATRPAPETKPSEPPAIQTIAAVPATAPSNAGSGWAPSKLFVALGGLLDGGTMPRSPAAGMEAAVGQTWQSPAWRLRLVGGPSFYAPEQLTRFPLEAGFPTGNYWMLSVSARGCLTAVLSRFEIGPCLGGELAVMHATNIGTTPSTSTQYWASPTGAVIAAVTILPEVVLFARTEIAIPSTRRIFLDQTNSQIYTVPMLAVRGAAGFELRFF